MTRGNRLPRGGCRFSLGKRVPTAGSSILRIRCRRVTRTADNWSISKPARASPSHTLRLYKLCRVQAMGAAAERMQLRCTVRLSPLASQRGSSNCERALTARLGATPGTGGSNRAWGAQRERVERTLPSTTAAARSIDPRAAVRCPVHTESGLC